MTATPRLRSEGDTLVAMNYAELHVSSQRTTTQEVYTLKDALQDLIHQASGFMQFSSL